MIPLFGSVSLLRAFGTGSPFLKARKTGSAVDVDCLLIADEKSEAEVMSSEFSTALSRWRPLRQCYSWSGWADPELPPEEDLPGFPFDTQCGTAAHWVRACLRHQDV